MSEGPTDPSRWLAGRTRETPIRRDGRGRWFHGQDPIDHPSLVRAFEAWVDVAEDGRYCLANDVNWAYVAIEGPPYFVREVRSTGADAELTLSGGRNERLDPATLREGPDGALYCDVSRGRLAARFDRHSMDRLVTTAGGEDEHGPYLELGGQRWRPSVVDDPLRPCSSAPSGPSAPSGGDDATA